MSRAGKLVVILAVLCGVAAYMAPKMSPEGSNSAEAERQPATEQQSRQNVVKGANKELIKYLTGPDEPKIKDAVWMNESNLYVGVIDDKTKRDGLAEYICQVAKDHGASAEMVKVVDVVKVQQGGNFEELGKAYCK